MNGKSTWKYNKLLTARRNYFVEGGPIGAVTKEATKGGSNFLQSFTSSLNPANIDWGNVAAGAIGDLGYGLLSGNKSSTAGNVIKTLGDLTGSPLLKTFAGGINAIFGSSLNTENIKNIENNIGTLRSYTADASDLDTAAKNMANAPVGMLFDKKDVGSDGLFSNKATRKYNSLKSDMAIGTQWVQDSNLNNIESILNSNNQMYNSNYAAYGGQLSYRRNVKSPNVDTFTQFKNIIRNNTGSVEDIINNINSSQRTLENYNRPKSRLYDEGGPIFNPFTKKWTRDEQKIEKRYDKDWGYVEYTDDGFAVNYNKKGVEIGRKKGTRTPYISGKGRNEQEQNYFTKDPEYTDSVKVIAARYGLNPNLVASRLAREGMDHFINIYNESGGKELISNSMEEAAVNGMLWGLDNIYSNIEDGSTKILEPWVNITNDFTFTNEKGQEVHTGYFNKWSDIISATAAELKAHRDRVAKKYPGLSEKQLDAAASASFNMGSSRVKKAIKDGTISKYKPFIKL